MDSNNSEQNRDLEEFPKHPDISEEELSVRDNQQDADMDDPDLADSSGQVESMEIEQDVERQDSSSSQILPQPDAVLPDTPSDEKLEKRGRPKGQSRVSIGKDYPCEYCSFSYKDYANLKAHLRVNHKDKTDISSEQSSSLGSPFRRGVAKGQRKESYGVQNPCQHCSCSYREKSALQAHIKTVHKELNLSSEQSSSSSSGRGGQKGQRKESYGVQNPCQHCSCSYKEKSALQAHIKTVHKDIYNASRSSLTPYAHKGRPKGQSRHSYGSAYPCQYCSNTYREKSSLIGHLKTVHTEEMSHMSKFTCVYPGCGKKFPTSLGKKLHESAHKRRTIDVEVKTEVEDDYCIVLDSNSFHESSERIDNQPTSTSRLQSVINSIDNYVAQNKQQSTMVSRANRMVSRPTTSRISVERSPSLIRVSSPLFTLQAIDDLSIKRDPSPVNFSKIDKSSLPLSAAIFLKAKEHPAEMMVVWSDHLEDDLLAAATHNPVNTIICIQNLNVFDVTNQQKQMVKNGDLLNFIIFDESGDFTHWTTITFGHQIPPFGIKNKSFKSLGEVEKIFIEHAGSHGMDIVNMMRYKEDGFYRLPSEKLSKKILLCNWSD